MGNARICTCRRAVEVGGNTLGTPAEAVSGIEFKVGGISVEQEPVS